MAQLIRLNTWVDFNVSTLQIFNESANLKSYEYVIELASDVAHSFFQTARYQQTTERNDSYNVDYITLGAAAEIGENMSSLTNTTTYGEAAMGIASASLPVGDRIVEILALKLFGNARAKAAISNDSAIASTVWRGPLETVFNADRNLIFEQYVGLDRIQNPANNQSGYNDTNGWANFNFGGITFEIPVHLTLGSVTADGNDNNEASYTSNLSVAAKTGPKFGTSSQIVDGTFDKACPLKLILRIANPVA